MLLNVWLMNICDAAYQRVILCNPSTIINHSQPSNNIILENIFKDQNTNILQSVNKSNHSLMECWCLSESEWSHQTIRVRTRLALKPVSVQKCFYLIEKEKKNVTLNLCRQRQKRKMRRSEIILTLLMSPSELVWESDTHTHNITNTAAAQYLQYQSLV